MVDYELVEVLTSFKNEIKEEMKNTMDSFKTEIRGEIDSFKAEIRGEMDSFKAEIKGELVTINERLTSVENRCTVIEEEHGRKLDLLLEYVSGNIEKNEEYDKSFNKINNKLFVHDAKLSVIEDSDIYQSQIKGKGKSNLKKAIL